MANTIEHINEPNRLILAWQASEPKGNRKRFAVGQVTKDGDDVTLTYFRDTPDVLEAKALGYEGYAAFSVQKAEHTKDVLAAFMRRLPPRSRPDFLQYLEGFRLPAHGRISDFALLAYSEAKLPSDGFSLVDPLDNSTPPREYVWEIAGYRHYAGLTEADIGSSVSLKVDPLNRFDPNAVAVEAKGRLIGYINRLQAGVVRRWALSDRVAASIDRLNGTTERPKALIFVRYI